MKTKKIFAGYLLIATLLMFSFFCVNTYGEEWIRTFGGMGYDIGYSVQQTVDGGFVIAGYTSSSGAGLEDVYLIKTNGIGTEQWSKTFGGTHTDTAKSVRQTADGGFIMTGTTSSFGDGTVNVYLVKTDGNGIEQWSNYFGGSSRDYAESVQQTADGGYIIAGYTTSFGLGAEDVYLIKTNSSGTEQWSKTFGGDSVDKGWSVQQTTDGGYIIAGNTQSFLAGANDVYLIKTDGDGNEDWSKLFGGSVNDYGYSVQQTTDGGYIIAGNTYGGVYLVKTDADGNEQWSNIIEESYGAGGQSVQQTTDGGYIVAGSRNVGFGNIQFYLLKTDGNGIKQWSRDFGENSSPEQAYSVQQTRNGGFIIVGGTYENSSDVYLVYYNPLTVSVSPLIPQLIPLLLF